MIGIPKEDPEIKLDGQTAKFKEGTSQAVDVNTRILAHIYQILVEIKARLDSPIINYTNHPPAPAPAATPTATTTTTKK